MLFQLYLYMLAQPTLLFLLLVCCALPLSAQKNSFDKLTQEACDCLAAQTTTAPSDIAQLEQKVDSCMQSSLVRHLGGLMVEKIVDVKNKDEVQAFGEKWGQKLYTDCAAYRQYWDFRAKSELRLKQSQLPTIEGKIARIERSVDNSRIVFWLRLPTMQVMAFAWLREFDGSARFFDSTDTYIGKQVRITWENTPIYNPKTRKYDTLREIQLIDELPTPATIQIDTPKSWAKLKRKQAKRYKKNMRRLRVKQAKQLLKAAKRE
jgi:hypothetical protein